MYTGMHAHLGPCIQPCIQLTASVFVALDRYWYLWYGLLQFPRYKCIHNRPQAKPSRPLLVGQVRNDNSRILVRDARCDLVAFQDRRPAF